MGYTVVEFKSGKGELAGEYSFVPSPSGGKKINQLAFPPNLPVIIKGPDTETVCL